jgi:pimeloyl-ACP methyl ester carboxylesterase
MTRPGDRDVVLLVHGLARTSWSMAPLERPLEDAGFEVRAWSYPSFSADVAALGPSLRAEIERLEREPGVARVHLVGHSLGAIAIRAALHGDGDRPRCIGRVVMLAPPNAGSPLARQVEPLLGWWLKPLAALTDAEDGAVRCMPVPQGVEIGVIAARWDGKVPVASTHLPGETDHVVVNGLHGSLMLQPSVQRQVVAFLTTGKFEKA